MNVILLINTCIAILSVMFIYQAFIDYMDARMIRFYQNNKFDQLKINIVIKFDGDYDELINQVHNIENQKYNNIEIIVLTGKKYFNELRQIIHDVDRKDLKIRIVKYNQGRNLANILNRICDSPLILTLNQGDRLSDKFLSSANNAAQANTSRSIIYPVRQLELNNTMVSLLIAQSNIINRFWVDMFGVKLNLSYIHTGVIYQNKVIKNNQIVRVSVSRLMSVSVKPSTTDMYDYINCKINDIRIKSGRMPYVFFGLLAMTFLMILVIVADVKLITTLAALVILAYFIVNLFMQFRYKGYSVIDRFNLIAVAPAALLVSVGIFIFGIFAVIMNLFNKNTSQNN